MYGEQLITEQELLRRYYYRILLQEDKKNLNQDRW
jgi:hypothetical protein